MTLALEAFFLPNEIHTHANGVISIYIVLTQQQYVLSFFIFPSFCLFHISLRSFCVGATLKFSVFNFYLENTPPPTLTGWFSFDLPVSRSGCLLLPGV